MQCPTLTKEVFKFPHKPVLRKYLKEYIDNYEINSKGVTGLTTEGNKDETTFLLRVVWGIAQAAIDEHGKKLK